MTFKAKLEKILGHKRLFLFFNIFIFFCKLFQVFIPNRISIIFIFFLHMMKSIHFYKNILIQVYIRGKLKSDWHILIPHFEPITCVNKRKMKIFLKILVIFWLWTSDWSKETKDCSISKEKHCCHDGLPLPIKRLSYEKCFLLPAVDLKLNSIFEVHIMFTGLNAIWNRIHLKLLCKLHFHLGSLI